MLITIFTPTYNRAHLLPRLYESLKAQTFQDFEWIIVDDGSTDDTEEIVKKWLQPPLTPSEGWENNLHHLGGIKGGFRYFKKPNGGKHRAINLGVQEARGELFFIVDSDDRLPSNAIERILNYYNQIKTYNRFAGVCGLKCYFNGTQVGGKQDFEPFDCSLLDIRHKYHLKGDMAEVVRTKVMQQYPFPEFEGERFCPEALIWNRIAQKYVMRYFHENVYECEYVEGGLTDRIVRVRMDSPRASMLTYKELAHYKVPLKTKIRSAINYWRFASCSNLPWLYKVKGMAMWLWLWPIGALMHIKDNKTQKNK